MKNKPELINAVFKFSQESNCCSDADGEELEVICDSVLGIEEDGGYFYWLKTGEGGWAIDDPDDLTELLTKCKVAVDSTIDENIYAKYNELLQEVQNKYPDESQHETALRHIKQAESSATTVGKENEVNQKS